MIRQNKDYSGLIEKLKTASKKCVFQRGGGYIVLIIKQHITFRNTRDRVVGPPYHGLWYFLCTHPLLVPRRIGRQGGIT